MVVFVLTHIILATAATAAIASETPAPTTQKVRASVERSLPFIKKVGTDWMQERKCNSCHVVTFLVWSHSEAAAHGLDVDRKELDDWRKWALADSLADKYWFQLRPRAMATLKGEGMAESLLAKLKPLSGKTHQTQKEYLAALEKAIGTDDLGREKDRLIRLATLPNNGGGTDTLAQLLLGRAALGEDKATTDSYNVIRALLMEWQEPEGSWKAAGQIPSMKWENEKEMHDATTMWSILAVSAGDPTNEAFVRSRERALETLRQSKPGVTMQTLALHMISAHKFGDPVRAEALRQELLGRQNADGGWAALRGNKASDAFGTGQALYALGVLGRNGNDPSVRRALQFLLETQGSDGGWEVPQNAVNTRVRKLNVYPFWGTAWAAIGMLQTLAAEEGRK
jgi:hypothetical protein